MPVRRFAVRSLAPALAWCVGLVALAFWQAPGKTTFDTKLDLTENPAGWLARALHMWNEQAGFGQVDNQAYGYLFSLGPFFLAGDLAGIPPWVTQRLWHAGLLVGAFVGMLLLLRALKVGDPPTRYVAAFAWALCPRMVTTLGPISAESLAVSLLPWSLLPLVNPRRDRSPARAAALSALAVLAIGGANGAVTVAVLPVPLLWLLVRLRDRWWRRLFVWWLRCVALAVLWWLGPLVMLAGWGSGFINRVEGAADTTGYISLWQAVRGADHWVAGVRRYGEAWWPAGWYVLDNPWAMTATAAFAVLGIAGLARADLPWRRFWVAVAFLGLVPLALGYAGTAGSPAGGVWRTLLDGPLVPFRNVHKFDPVLRLPLIVGLAHILSRIRRPVLRGAVRGARRLSRLGPGFAMPARQAAHAGTAALAAVVAILTLVTAGPAVAGQLRVAPAFDGIPGYWRQAADWLDGAAGDRAVMVVPGAGFGEYSWGRTVDEPLQPLAKVRWTVRGQVPLGAEASVRWMDAVELVLASGQGSPALGAYLARGGVSHLVVRNDLEWWRSGSPRPAIVHQALARSGGLTRVATFGPVVGGGTRDELHAVAYSVDPGYPALEVYRVEHDVSVASVVDATRVPAVSGGPESLLPLLEDGLLHADTPVAMAGDPLGPRTTRWLATDGLRRREVNIGRVHHNTGAAMTADEPFRVDRRVHDAEPFPPAGHQTVAEYHGIRAVRASSSLGYPDSLEPTRLEFHPFAALDGDPDSFWRSSTYGSPVGQWLEFELDRPRLVDALAVRLVDSVLVGPRITRLEVRTDAGTRVVDVAAGGRDFNVPLPPGTTGRVRLTVRAVAAGGDGQVGIREVAVPGRHPSRTLRLPDDPPAGLAAPGPDALSMRQEPLLRPSCLQVALSTRCDPTLRSGAEDLHLDRTIPIRDHGRYQLDAVAYARPGPAAQALLDRPDPFLVVEASSTFFGEPATAAALAFDHNPATAWLADPLDRRPTLAYRWLGSRRIDRLQVVVAEHPASVRPVRLTLTAPSGVRRLTIFGSGTYRFPALTTHRVEVRIEESSTARSIDPFTGFGSPLPVGVAELAFPAVAHLVHAPVPSLPLRSACGSGPQLEVDQRVLQTRVVGTVRDVLEQRPVRVVACGGRSLTFAPGTHRIRFLPSAAFAVTAATLRRDGYRAIPDPTSTPRVVSWQPGDRRLRIGPVWAPSLLVVRENANPGWVATLDGRKLRAVRVDGWLQAWEVPAGASGTVHLTFTPDFRYRVLLLIGGVAAALLLALPLLLWLLRRFRPPPERSGAVDVPGEPRWLGWVPAGAVLLLGGVAGVVVLGGAVLLRRRSRLLMVAAPVLVAVASAFAIDGRITQRDHVDAIGPLVQVLMLAALACLAVGVLPAVRWPFRRRARRA